ncbi:MAG: carboxylesterase family protein [Pseudomonadales bacterium]|nr:carboxylesterase family protein [Pseudomonadales bacterium]
MLKKVLIVLSTLVVIVAVLVAFLGYKFSQSGDDYGEQRQLADPETIRKTAYGDVVGFLDISESHTWMGIPFATPPVGDLRWRAPVEPALWQGTLDALKASDRCKQIGSVSESRPREEHGKPIGSEDCLYLNIFAPKFANGRVPTGNDRLPVMVYIHGGGNVAGYANQFKYSGRNLAKNHDVIVVNFNYRLGLFGWLSHPSLNLDGSLEDKSGNFGILDSLAALEWVQDNIEAFGGDPTNVTLFGESAGGINIFAILASQLGEGLFHKAIIQSGLPISTPMDQATNYIEDSGHLNSGREITNQLLIADATAASRQEAISHQNQMSDAEISRYLRGKSANAVLMLLGSDGMPSMPMIFRDGTVVPREDLMEVFSDAANYNAVPIIIGTNRDEFKPFFAGDSSLVELQMGFLPKIINEAYFHAVTSYFNDAWKARGVDEVSMRLAESQSDPVFAYRFDWDELPSILGVDLSKLMGAVHASEIPFVFESFDDRLMNWVLFSDENIPSRTELSKKMSSYWAEFAYNSSPGRGRDGTQTDWTPWDENPDQGKFVILDSERDRGIRMNNQAVTFSVLKHRLLQDTAFPTTAAKGKIYDCIFRDSKHWDEEEFKSLGGKTCHIPIFQFLRL